MLLFGWWLWCAASCRYISILLLTRCNFFLLYHAGVEVSHYANVCSRRLGKILQTGAKRVSLKFML